MFKQVNIRNIIQYTILELGKKDFNSSSQRIKIIATIKPKNIRLERDSPGPINSETPGGAVLYQLSSQANW